MTPERKNKQKKSDSDKITIALVGQPNCGKSTIFNEVAGYKSIASNFPGATVVYTHTQVRIGTCVCQIVDLPGIYSLTGNDEISRDTQKYLLEEPIDVLINVLDSSLLSRSLEFTLQLMELDIPMILDLNMIDEAERKGIEIHVTKLSRLLGISVLSTVASKGKGVSELLTQALQTARERKLPSHIKGHKDVEVRIEEMMNILNNVVEFDERLSKHLVATRLMERNEYFEQMIKQKNPELITNIETFRNEIEDLHGTTSDEVINAERHSLSMSIYEKVIRLKKSHIDWRDRIDSVLMHNFWGYFFLVAILLVFFNVIFTFGEMIEKPLTGFFDNIAAWVYNILSAGSLISVIAKGAVQGIGGGIAIVLPYLIPFLIGLAFLEDIGYLPRVAFLMDGIMHKIGLHGKSVIPVVLGYGCNVPAVMATKIIESPRDRFITAMIATMVPCAARMTIIMGLVGYYLGGTYVFVIYFLNLIIIGITGTIMKRLLPEITPGLMLEIPAYKVPQFKVLLMKTWLRLKDFIIIAWPLLIAGSAVLALVEYFNFSQIINNVLSPLTGLLGVPSKVGVTLIFGVLRKELSMLMLMQAFGTSDLSSVMNAGQILVFTIFVVFYIPCVATIGALWKQIKAKKTLLIILLTTVIALILGVLARGVVYIIW
ncbi:MAG: ferrous iron transport protein B [bacterium]